MWIPTLLHGREPNLQFDAVKAMHENQEPVGFHVPKLQLAMRGNQTKELAGQQRAD